MGEDTEVRSSTHEQMLIDIMRRLPEEQIVQLASFAYFLELQATEEYEKWLEEGSPETGEKGWEKLLAEPEARRVMRDMVREARDEYSTGGMTEIEVTEDGRLSPA